MKKVRGRWCCADPAQVTAAGPSAPLNRHNLSRTEMQNPATHCACMPTS